MDKEAKLRFAKHLGLLLLTTTALVGHANGEVSAANGILKNSTPVVIPDSLPERYHELTPTPTLTPTIIPTPESTPNPIRRLLASATKTPVEQFTRTDWIKMLEELHSKQEFTVADSLTAVEQASPQVACTKFYEAGRDTKYFKAYDPYVLDGPNIEEAKYFGLGQFAIDGKMSEFFRLGHTDLFDPYQVVAYMNDAFARAQQWAWGPMNKGLC